MYCYVSGPMQLQKSEDNQGFAFLNIKGKIYSWTIWKINSIFVLGTFTPPGLFTKMKTKHTKSPSNNMKKCTGKG